MKSYVYIKNEGKRRAFVCACNKEYFDILLNSCKDKNVRHKVTEKGRKLTVYFQHDHTVQIIVILK